MKNINKFFWGILLIIIGIIYGLNAFEITDINIFFDGWWTLFIIIPCFLNLIKGKDATGNLIGMLIGCSLLLLTRGLISFDKLASLIIPTVLILLGLTILLKTRTTEVNEKIKTLNKKNAPTEYYATFASQEIILENKLKNIDLNAIFGSITCDLRKVVIEEDAVINITVIFGSVDLLVADDVEIKIKPTTIFGAIENKKDVKDAKSKKKIYINSTCLFGGVDIK